MMVKWNDVKDDYAKKDAEIKRLKEKVEIKDKYILELEGNENSIALCVHKSSMKHRDKQIRGLETMLSARNKQLEKAWVNCCHLEKCGLLELTD